MISLLDQDPQKVATMAIHIRHRIIHPNGTMVQQHNQARRHIQWSTEG